MCTERHCGKSGSFRMLGLWCILSSRSVNRSTVIQLCPAGGPHPRSITAHPRSYWPTQQPKYSQHAITAVSAPAAPLPAARTAETASGPRTEHSKHCRTTTQRPLYPAKCKYAPKATLVLFYFRTVGQVFVWQHLQTTAWQQPAAADRPPSVCGESLLFFYFVELFLSYLLYYIIFYFRLEL